MMQKKFVLSVATALVGLALVPGIAQAQSQAYTNGPVNVRAGPAPDYPIVTQLPPGVPVTVMGCTVSYQWCDVALPNLRGWAYGGSLAYPYEGNNVPILDYGYSIGLPIVGFSLGSYWDSYYRGRPWYGERGRFENHPPPRPLPGRPGGGRPGFGGPGGPGRPGEGFGGPGRPGGPGGPGRPGGGFEGRPGPGPGPGRPGGGFEGRPGPGRPEPGRPEQGRPQGGGGPGRGEEARPQGPQGGGGRPPENRPSGGGGERGGGGEHGGGGERGGGGGGGEHGGGGERH